MIVTVEAKEINGALEASSSKSHIQRVLAAAALAQGKSSIHFFGNNADSMNALKIIQNIGAQVVDYDTIIEVTGKKQAIKPEWNCGESGLGIRMFSSIAALFDTEITLNGHGSLVTRPMHFFEEVFPQLGVQCTTNNGKLPITIKGPLQAGEITIDGSLSSQYLTGLLIALPLATGDSIVHVKELKSKPYIDLTLRVLQDFGIHITHNAYQTFHIPGKQSYQAREIDIEGDWSSASFPLVAAAIGGEVQIERLSVNSTQADKAILDAIRKAGALVEVNDNSVRVSHQALKAFEFDATDCPDLFPPLLVLAAKAKGQSKIHGVERLYHKESNRAIVLRDEFAKLGVSVKLDGDTMLIDGVEKLSDGVIHSHNDHRIAMAATILAAVSPCQIEIIKAECINKSYPEFYEDMKEIGFQIAQVRELPKGALEQLMRERSEGRSFESIREELEQKGFDSYDIKQMISSISDDDLEQLKIKDERRTQIIGIAIGAILFFIGGAIHLNRYINEIPYTRQELIIPFGLMTLGYFVFRKSWRNFQAYEKVD
jgi:3-phosphoshikimate 1-carboxyvinyltransferase